MPPKSLKSNRLSIGHAVNSQKRLRWFLARGLDLAEGDVSWGRHLPSRGKTAIMAHPPDRESDLSFDQWIDAALKAGHAIKVDLKSRKVIPHVLAVLDARRYPEKHLVINADVVRGPRGKKPLFGLRDMLALRRRFPRAILSLGFTIDSRPHPYNHGQIERMLRFAKKVGRTVTVCLRSNNALAAPEVVADLIRNHRVTIFNSIETPVGPKTVRHWRGKVRRGFIDLMDAHGRPVGSSLPS